MFDKVIGVFVWIVVLAIIAVVVSRRAQTAAVLKTLLSGFSGAITAAQKPVTV